jgi:YVTN family beta-propeller protein
MSRLGEAAGALLLILAAGSARAEEPAGPLQLERTIALADVAGRIDHLSVDLRRNRLFVAELGNGTVDVIDLATGNSIDRISGLAEPQGIAYAPASDRLVVANGGDGTVRVFRGDDFSAAGAIDLGQDADNVRVDPRNGHVLVGYGSGGIAVLEPASVSKLADIRLAVHPEGFQLEPGGGRIFVNLPDARQIGVLDLESNRQTASWTVPDLNSNYPLAVDESGSLLTTLFRSPPRLVLLDTQSGAVVANLDACGDADDVFFDAPRQWIYISCGEGAVEVFQSEGATTHRLGRIRTPPGGRTSLFVPELDRLFVAVRARLLRSQASILVFRPTKFPRS